MWHGAGRMRGYRRLGVSRRDAGRAIPAVLLACLLGVPLGIGAFTFVYAKGLSYLSTDPRACVNCHIMNPQYDAWLKSGHRHTATCVECHLPHAGLAKWVAKAEHGFRHSAAFTLQNFKEPIEITARDRALVRANCLRCHEALVHAVADGGGARGELDCLHCHATAGHGG
jgi:cytochrome c nitrite reductase small subunit